ncbi:MAG TPA: PmoA family protein [Phycisphaerae bacterium]|nr:PmoA family protein [Phycisphaerae bacterium]
MKKAYRTTTHVICGLMVTLACTAGGHAAPVRIVILSGQTVHDTKSTTPFLEGLYAADPKRFNVLDIVEDVSKITAETFARCDVIVSNWTCHPTMTGGPWTQEGKQAFADAIRKGTGMVSFHAASAACNDWPEFQQISGLTWKLGHTSHTSYHTFKVVINDNKHPITRGMPDFWITDELYQRMVKLTPTDFRTLATAFANTDVSGTGAWEPMLIVTQLGKGRGVNFLLGHDVPAMRNIAWQTIMLRATEWAATGKVTVPIPKEWPSTPAAAALVGVDADAAIRAATQYAHGEPREPLFVVEQLVNHATSNTSKTAAEDRARLAAQLGEAIAACKTAEARSFFCRQLGMIGTPAQVPVIAPLLADEGTATMARFALERIAGPEAAAALREALSTLKGNLLIGVIASIGTRADADSVPALVPLLRDTDPAVARAAASALGLIGTPEAAEAIKAARLATSDPAMRAVLTDAYLACGERLIAAGDKKTAAGVYKLLYAPAEPPAVRAAAFRGLILSQPVQATPLIKEALESNVPELIVAVANIVRELPKVGDTKAIAGAALHVPADLQVIMIQAFAERGDKAAVDNARRGLVHENPQVRLVSIDALARLGDESDAGLLADRAMRGEPPERTAAMDALRRMPGTAAEDTLVNLLLGEDDQTRSAAARALVNRPANAKVFEVLGNFREENVQVALLGVLDQLGNDEALAILKHEAAAESAAVRSAALSALMNWPTSAAASVLLQALQDHRNEAMRPAILTALARMVPGELPAAEWVAGVGKLFETAGSPDEREAALNILGNITTPEALSLAVSQTQRADVADVAAETALKIATALVDTHKDAVRLAARELIANARSPEIIKRADVLQRRAERPPNLARGAAADSPDDLDADGGAGGDQAAIDGDPKTYWDEVDNKDLYRLRVTFEQPTRVSAINIVGYEYESHCPKDFDILCDDKVVKRVSNAVYDRTSVEAFFTFEPVTCTTLELRITGYYPASPAIRELEIFDWPQATPESQPGSTPSAAASPAYRWAQTDDSIALLNGDRIVWRFNYGKDLPKAYFDPLNLPDGTELVWLSPPDHEWHFALWFSWKEINGLNYWEQWNTPGQGRTRVLDGRARANPDHSADIDLTVSYHPDGKPALLTERRSIHVHPPEADGSYRIDWTSAFTAGAEDVHLKGGTAGGGYAGLSVRISPRTREWQLLDSEGRRDQPCEGMARHTHGQRSKWCDFSLVGMLTGSPAGVTVFDHPANLRHPSYWHNLIDDRIPFGYFSPALLWAEPYTLPAGQELVLRYRILIHAGRPDAERFDAEWHAFSTAKLAEP